MRTLFSDFTEVGRSDLLSVCIVVVLTSPVSPYIIMSRDDHTEIFPRLFGVNIWRTALLPIQTLRARVPLNRYVTERNQARDAKRPVNGGSHRETPRPSGQILSKLLLTNCAGNVDIWADHRLCQAEIDGLVDLFLLASRRWNSKFQGYLKLPGSASRCAPPKKGGGNDSLVFRFKCRPSVRPASHERTWRIGSNTEACNDRTKVVRGAVYLTPNLTEP